MPSNIITLTTDFGADSHYVSQMKAVILTACPDVTLVDITHSVPPQDIRFGAVTLLDSCLWFPPMTIHVAVVDPGVGSSRGILAAKIANQLFIAPDNGLLSRLIDSRGLEKAVRIDRVLSDSSSATFHGRDIMAPVASMLSAGITSFEELGSPVGEVERLPPARLSALEEGAEGEVETIDAFGNLISNIPGDWITQDERAIEVHCAERVVHGLVTHYSASPGGELVALIGSHGRLELAVVNGSARRMLGAVLGQHLEVRWSPPSGE